MEPLETITLAVAVAGLIPLYLDLINRRKEKQPHFRLTRIFGDRQEWIESKSGIIIECSDKPIEKCSITCGGIPLPCGKKKGVLQYQWYVTAVEGVLFDIPINAEKEDALVIVKSGKKKIGSPTKLRDIPQE
jgi:hypothetical protein